MSLKTGWGFVLRVLLVLSLGATASACAPPPTPRVVDAREVSRPSAAVEAVAPIAAEVAASAPSAIDSEDPPANTVITLQRGGCERRCAVYRITIFADGTAVYEGQHYVRKAGVVVEKLDVTAVRSLVATFRAIGYFDLLGDYGYSSLDGCESGEDDAPVAMTSIVLGTKSKAVVHHHRCRGPVPAKLRELEDAIDRALNSVRFIR